MSAIFIDGTPYIDNKNQTDFGLNVKTDINATVKYMLVPKDATAPTASEIENNTYTGTVIRTGQITTTANVLSQRVVG